MYDRGDVSREKLRWFDMMHDRRNSLTVELWTVGFAIIVFMIGFGWMIYTIIA